MLFLNLREFIDFWKICAPLVYKHRGALIFGPSNRRSTLLGVISEKTMYLQYRVKLPILILGPQAVQEEFRLDCVTLMMEELNSFKTS